MKAQNEHFALVTGASAGIGKALAEELAKRHHNLLLVSLPGTGLEDQCKDLSVRHRIKAVCYEADLSNGFSVDHLLAFTTEHGISFDILINNVGMGYGGEIGSYSEKALHDTVFLNMKCATVITNAFIDSLKEREEAFILNMGSFGGFAPMPFKSVYAASKSYIYHFSLSLREELKCTPVSVSVAMPSAVATNEKVRERIDKLGILARSNTLTPQEAATEMIDGMFRRKAVILPGKMVKVMYFAGSLLPYGILKKILMNIFRGVN